MSELAILLRQISPLAEHIQVTAAGIYRTLTDRFIQLNIPLSREAVDEPRLPEKITEALTLRYSYNSYNSGIQLRFKDAWLIAADEYGYNYLYDLTLELPFAASNDRDNQFISATFAPLIPVKRETITVYGRSTLYLHTLRRPYARPSYRRAQHFASVELFANTYLAHRNQQAARAARYQPKRNQLIAEATTHNRSVIRGMSQKAIMDTFRPYQVSLLNESGTWPSDIPIPAELQSP